MSYVDTSLIVAALDPLDPRQKSALKALEGEGDKKISEFVIVELASVLSRRDALYKVFREIGVREELTIPAVILYIMKRFGLKYKRVDGRGRALPLGDFYLPLAAAVKLSSKFKLKTLDLIHLAYIKTLMDQGEEIFELITVDDDFEREKGNIKRELRIDVRTLSSSQT